MGFESLLPFLQQLGLSPGSNLGFNAATSPTGGSLAPYDPMAAANTIGGNGLDLKKLLLMGMLKGGGNAMSNPQGRMPSMLPGMSGPMSSAPNPFASLIQPLTRGY